MLIVSAEPGEVITVVEFVVEGSAVCVAVLSFVVSADCVMASGVPAVRNKIRYIIIYIAILMLKMYVRV